MEDKGFNENEISEKSKEALQSEIGKQAVENDNEDIASKDCDGIAEETQIKEDGKQNSSVYIGVVGAVTKLQEELKKAKEKDFAKPVIEHLIERCKDSASLASDICQEHKTWEKCYKYIYEQARKQIKGSSGAVRDDVVYEWAEDYYHMDDKAEEEKKAKEEAGRKKKQKERIKGMEKRKTSKSSGVDSTPKASEKKEVAPKAAPTEKPKKSNTDMDGQMDLFSLMGL